MAIFALPGAAILLTSDVLAGDGDAPYVVQDGKVDPGTYNGYRRYHAGCSHCHGPDGVGSSFGPSLIERSLDFASFEETVLNGAGEGTSVMKGFANDANVVPYMMDLFAYLSARADGALGRGRPQRLPKED